MINVHRLAAMAPADLARIKRRAESNIDEIIDMAREMIEQIRQQGDAAMLEYVRRFDYASASSDNLKVSEQEFAHARETLQPAIKEAVLHAHANIKAFHEQQMPEPMWFTELAEGVMAGEKITPIASAGLYVPRGKGSFPSVMLMLCVPATVAGVGRVCVATPPDKDGQVDAASLFAAELCGVRDIYKFGGIQAVAALALGTATVPKVDKITGPGSIYVAAAKRLLYGTVDVGLPAGPSEAIVLADEHADPRIAALDLLNEAEHGPESAALLVTHSEALADAVAAAVPQYLQVLPQWRREFCETVLSSYGGILLTDSLRQSIDFVNDYAPEHLSIHVQDLFGVLNRIQHAGEILLGSHTPIAISNYSLGLNAILPTGGSGRSYSSVSVYDFLKRSGIGYLTREGFERLKQTTALLADYEDFPMHALAVREREKIFAEKDKQG